MSMPSAEISSPSNPTTNTDSVTLENANTFAGVMNIGGSFAYVFYGVSCSQMIWYFRSYPNDPWKFKTFIGAIFLTNSLNLLSTVWLLYWMLVLRGIGVDPHFFVYCDYWATSSVMVLTEINCALVELFFISRIWRFAEQKWLAILAFIPYTFATGFNISKTQGYLKGMIEVPCYPEMEVNRIWLLLAYGFKILSDGIIAGTMTWLLYHRSKGVRQDGGMIRVVRELMYWSLSTGLILWVSTLVHVLTYTILSDTLISTGTYLTRSQIYTIAMLAGINDRQRAQEIIQQPESISVRVATLKAVSRFQTGMITKPVATHSSGIQCAVHTDSSSKQE